MRPKLSVVMPVYNCEEFIGETLVSVLDQSFTDFELLIVDDNSTDGSLKRINSFRDARIKILRNESRGCANAYNTGIKNSASEIIALMDHDDIAFRQRFEKQLIFLTEHGEMDLVSCWYNIISENGKILHTVKTPCEDYEIKRELHVRNCILNPGIMIRKRVFGEFGFFRQDYFPVHDFEFLLRVSSNTCMHNLPEVLHNWRSRIDSPSNRMAGAMNKSAVSLASEYNQRDFNSGIITGGAFLFRTGRVIYYHDSPLRSVKYFAGSLFSGNNARASLRFLILAGLCFPVIWLYRNTIIKYRYGGYVSFKI